MSNVKDIGGVPHVWSVHAHAWVTVEHQQYLSNVDRARARKQRGANKRAKARGTKFRNML